MATSKIEWTDETWNPITGCTKCSQGCENCYAASFAERLRCMGSERYSNGFKVAVHPEIFEMPLGWKKPRKVFVNSMSDIFHEEVNEDDILALFDVMNRAERHIFQVLTKRAERLKELDKKIKWTSNIWMGVSVESNIYNSRVDLLRTCGAKCKFVSAEPLLGPLKDLDLSEIDWLIVGGESGPRSRPMKEEWVIDLKEKAIDAGVAFFFKQWGGTNKKKSGSLLQGKYYKEYPTLK